MVEKILNSITPYGEIMASHEGLLHSSTLKRSVSHSIFTFDSSELCVLNIPINY